jgi:hypothetical protein
MKQKPHRLISKPIYLKRTSNHNKFTKKKSSKAC